MRNLQSDFDESALNPAWDDDGPGFCRERAVSMLVYLAKRAPENGHETIAADMQYSRDDSGVKEAAHAELLHYQDMSGLLQCPLVLDDLIHVLRSGFDAEPFEAAFYAFSHGCTVEEWCKDAILLDFAALITETLYAADPSQDLS